MADREQIEEMIRQRAEARGLDPDFAVRVAELESSMNPNARNRRSTASGLFQLTDGRRREIGVPVKKAATIEEQIDHGITSLLMAEKYLESRLERRPEFFETYAAHFSGPFGSVKVLKADPQAPINQVLSARAVSSNPKLKGRTTGEVKENWRSKFEDLVQKKAAAPVKEPAPAELYPTNEPDWGAIGRSQLTAQGPRPEAEPIASEPMASEPMALMAEGGMVDDEDSPFNQQLTRMVQMARSDSDFARINRMLADGPQGFDEGGEVKGERSAKEMLADMELTPEERERLSKPAFGVVPSSGKGRKQSRVSEALQSGEAQLAAAKGMTMLPQNLVGSGVDIATMLMRPFGYNVEKPVGGSEYLKEKSRQAGVAFQEPEDPTLRAFFTAGDIGSNLVNPAGATRTAVRGAEKTGEAAKALAEFATRPVERDPFFAGPMGRQRGAIKAKGGNWLAGEVEGATEPLRPRGPTHRDEALMIGGEWPAFVETPQGKAVMAQNDALNNWIDKKLNRYIKNEMATPEDPVRKLAERGILHVEPEVLNFAPEFYRPGMAPGQVLHAQSDLAKAWEGTADQALLNFSVRDLKESPSKLLEKNPWAKNLPDETKISSVAEPKFFRNDVGFDHLIDVLREDLAAGRMTPEQLNKMSMEAAVQRAHEYNVELAKKMADANLALRKDFPVFKTYPDTGYRWVELNRPGAFAAESDAMGHSVRGYEPPKGHPDWVEKSGDSGSSGYGLGGWEAVKSGKVKVYSLEDAQGSPHATIETYRTGHPIGFASSPNALSGLPVTGPDNKTFTAYFPRTFEYRSYDDSGKVLTPEQQIAIQNRAQAIYTQMAQDLLKTDPSYREAMLRATWKLPGAGAQYAPRGPEFMDAYQKAADEVLGELPRSINQIKGKKNGALVQKYEKYGQDFIKGQEWGDIRDLENVGLVQIYPESDLARALKARNMPVPRYVTQEELTQLLNQTRLPPEANYKDGGEVKNDDSAKAQLEALKRRIGDEIVGEQLRKAADSPQYGDLVEYLSARRSMPEIKYKSGIRGQFSSGWGMPARGEIALGSWATPSTVVHELTHAADNQISQQYYDLAKKQKLDPLEKQFMQTYEKLVFSPNKSQGDPEKYPRAAMAERLAPEWAKKERDYRSTSGEMVAFGMGRPVAEAQRYMPSNIAPPHVDPTMATEFSVLLDIAKRLQKSKPVTDKR